MKLHVLIDDIRDCGCDVICRDGETGLTILRNLKGKVEKVYFDHDLGPHSIWSGYRTLLKCLEEDLLPNKIQLVTSNPVGRERMALALINEGYHPSPNKIDFEKV